MAILTIGGKTITELDGSEEIHYDSSNPQIIRRIMSDWADAPAVVEALLGTVSRIGIATTVRTAPTPHPNPKYSFLFAQRARVSGYGVPSQDSYGIISYHKAIIEVEYLPPLPMGGGDSVTFVTERREMGAEFMTLPRQRLFWASQDSIQATTASTQSLGDDARPGRVLPLMHLTVDIQHWTTADERITNGVFESSIGKVNARDYQFLYTLWPAETLLFNGASFIRQYPAGGAPGWQVSLLFTFKRTRWNRIPDTRAATAVDGFHTYCRSDGSRVYERMDFRTLMPTGYRPLPIWYDPNTGVPRPPLPPVMP